MSYKIKTEVEVSKKRLSDLVCTAFEGGVGYWCCIEKYVEPKEITFRSDDERIYRHIDYPLNPGGGMIVSVVESELLYDVNEPVLVKGLETMALKYPRHFADFLNENEDGNTADVFLQCALFGEITYG